MRLLRGLLAALALLVPAAALAVILAGNGVASRRRTAAP